MTSVALQSTERFVARAAAAHKGGSPALGRLLDVALCLPILLLVLPLMSLTALCIYVEDGGPIFFVQPRVGRGGCSFACLKFRSMCVDAEQRIAAHFSRHPEAQIEYARNRKLRADPRVTFVGRFLRRYSIDELPQFINVLIGDMSLVGPRPIMMGEATAYGYRLRHYCSVRPGLTGLWQVMGRNHRSFRSRVAMDVLYIRSKSLSTDLKIILATIPAVLRATGSY